MAGINVLTKNRRAQAGRFQVRAQIGRAQAGRHQENNHRSDRTIEQ
jgi:hypothetical protein